MVNKDMKERKNVNVIHKIHIKYINKKFTDIFLPVNSSSLSITRACICGMIVIITRLY